jgi:two-component system sensor histidine kinase ChvG
MAWVINIKKRNMGPPDGRPGFAGQAVSLSTKPSAAGTSSLQKPAKRAKSRREKRQGPRRSVLASRLTRAIFLSNLIGLVVLTIGSLAMGRFQDGLVEAEMVNMRSTSSTIATIMADGATGYGLSAKLDVDTAASILRQINIPDTWRVRLFDGSGLLLVDSARLEDNISVSQLEPVIEAQVPPSWHETYMARAREITVSTVSNLPWLKTRRERLRHDLKGDVRRALDGDIMSGERYNVQNQRIVTVAQPVRRVQHVLGVISLESRNIDGIINAERRALMPFIGLALIAMLFSSLALTLFIALPMRRLARAAEDVTRSSRNRDVIPDLSGRRDEIGDLSIVLDEMTQGLYRRVDDIANFAGDVAHEIKNPLTSLRSASDTLRGARTAEQREKLLDVIENDVARMDRLISDISKASKVDANLAKDTAETVDVSDVLTNLAHFYNQSQQEVEVLFVKDPASTSPLWVRAFESPFAQVFRNLIDNALTFSPAGGKIILRAWPAEEDNKSLVVISVEDDGPGIPPGNIETIFDRFYTERPKGSEFGSHSGLGLAICRQIITAHKGHIYAENKAETADNGSGARFIIKLPRQSGSLGKRK